MAEAIETTETVEVPEIANIHAVLKTRCNSEQAGESIPPSPPYTFQSYSLNCRLPVDVTVTL